MHAKAISIHLKHFLLLRFPETYPQIEPVGFLSFGLGPDPQAIAAFLVAPLHYMLYEQFTYSFPPFPLINHQAADLNKRTALDPDGFESMDPAYNSFFVQGHERLMVLHKPYLFDLHPGFLHR